MRDWKWACLAASVLLGIASWIVFVVRPGGFEGQIGWFFGLLPGAAVVASVGAAVGARSHPTTPLGESIALWGSIIGISFLWYFVVSYAVIKVCRLASRTSRR